MARKKNKLPFVLAASRIKESLRQGHPWVYRDAIERAPAELATGDWVRVQSGNMQFFGLWDSNGPIAVRLFSSRRKPERAWVAARVRQAWELREPLRRPEAQTSAYRWLYGESDGLPGIVVDLYGDCETRERWAVVQTYADSLERLKPWISDALQDTVALAGIIARNGQEGRGATLLAGRHPPPAIIIAENGLRFEVDVMRGQKTGFYLDQRQNRKTIEGWSRGKRVLNLFAYTGGFSVYAVRGGAAEVTSVDGAQAALEAAERNFRLNGFEPSAHGFTVGDCFEVLEKYHREGRRFDLIIVDPPSFARSKAQLPAALNAYRRLNALALLCLVPNGLLASSSCTSQVSAEAFRQMLSEAAAKARKRLLFLHEAGQPLDHPVPAHFPEGRYLKFALAHVRDLV